MRLLTSLPWLLLGSLTTAIASDKEPMIPQGFQLPDGDLHAASGIMDEALQDVWHSYYLENAALEIERAQRLHSRDPIVPELPPPDAASDEVFLRRATLDATDVIPTAEEVRAFLADPAPYKRDRLVDRLLLSPGRAQRQFNRFADLMRLRDVVGGIPQAGYIALVRAAAETNLPFDQFVHTLLTASGNVPDNPATGFLLRDQGNLLQTMDEIEWGFLRENVHCAVCHDHPFNDTTQHQFYELASCLGASQVLLRKPGANVASETEVWPRDAYQSARSNSLSRDGLLTIRDGLQFGLHLPSDYRYRDGKPDRLLKKATPLPFEKAQDKVVWNNAKGLREEFARWLISQERFAQVAAVREWTFLFGMPRLAESHSGTDFQSLVEPNPAGPFPLSTNLHAACCDSNGWGVSEFAYESFGQRMPASQFKFLKSLSALMRHVHFDLREFQRVLMHTKAYGRVATPNSEMGAPRFGQPLAPFMRRLSSEQLWNSLVLLGGVDGAEWRFASELPQSLPNTHALLVLGRGARLRSEDSTRTITFSMARFMMNSTAVKHATEAPTSIVARTEAQYKNSPVNRVEPLFLAILGRAPADEREQTRALGTALQPEGLRQLAWSLLNTSEFLFEQ